MHADRDFIVIKTWCIHRFELVDGDVSEVAIFVNALFSKSCHAILPRFDFRVDVFVGVAWFCELVLVRGGLNVDACW